MKPEKTTEKVKCPVCGSTNIETETPDVARCKKCGHLISIGAN
jgi:ribosomal protein L37AE/L43A